MKTRTVRILQNLVIFLGFVFIGWGLAQYQTYTLEKDVGVDGAATLTTEEIPPGAIMTVHTSSTQRMDTRVVALDSRELVYVGNSSYYDKHLAAGGPPGNGVGKDVSLWTISKGQTHYMIIVKAPTETTLDYTEADVSLKVEVNIWTPNFLILFSGIVLTSCAMMVGTVLGIGIFGPPRFVPGMAQAPAPRPAPVEAREVPPVEREAPPPPVITAPPVRKAPPPAVPPPESPFEPRIEVQPQEFAPPPMPARRGEPLWDVSPAAVPRPAAVPAPVPMQQAAPLKKIKCSACGAVIPIYTNERPLRVTCPLCGRQGTLR
jgi:hypothetical protein